MLGLPASAKEPALVATPGPAFTNFCHSDVDYSNGSFRYILTDIQCWLFKGLSKLADNLCQYRPHHVNFHFAKCSPLFPNFIT